MLGGAVELSGTVQHGAVVPDDDIADRPFVSVDVSRLGREPGQPLEQRLALPMRHAVNPPRVSTDIDGFPSGTRNEAHQGLDDRRQAAVPVVKLWEDSVRKAGYDPAVVLKEMNDELRKESAQF